MASPGGADARADWLLVGLGNPGSEYARTRHNIGFRIAERLILRWGLPKPRAKYRGLITDGRIGPGAPRVAVLLPQTYMNDSGRSAGPAAGAYRIPPERVVALYDEIDVPFVEVRVRQGGGVAGHNGVKAVREGFGSTDFWRIRAGVGRPDSTDPEIVSAWVLGRFREADAEVDALVSAAADAAERLVLEGQPIS